MGLSAELNLDKPFEDVRHEAMLNIVHTANQVSLLGASFFRPHQLTEAQWNVLFALKYKAVELTQSDLGKRLVVTRASITSVLDKLEEKELVERRSVPGNRRIHHVELTRKGHALVERLEPVYREEVHAALNGFGDGELRVLIGCLERIRSNTKALRKENGDAGDWE